MTAVDYLKLTVVIVVLSPVLLLLILAAYQFLSAPFREHFDYRPWFAELLVLLSSVVLYLIFRR